MKNAVVEAVKTLGRLDVLVNNAGIAKIGPPDQFSLADFDRSVAVNVRAVVVAAQEASRHMKNGGCRFRRMTESRVDSTVCNLDFLLSTGLHYGNIAA